MVNTTRKSNRHGYGLLVVVLGWLALNMPNAQAIPSMARQMGVPCAACHTVFPELTPFGRQFKLGGFSLSAQGPDAPFFDKVPVSALLQVSRTATKNTGTDGAMSDDFSRDRETIVQAAGFYWGGKIVDNAGALVQYNYNGFERKWGMEMFDARYGNTTTVAGKGLAWGVSVNNAPTLSDIYNSTPVWSLPHTDSATVMPAASTLLDMTLASQVAGVTAYGLWDDSWYGEFGAYRTAKRGFFRFMGQNDPTDTVVDGNAPYWRFAWQKENGPHSFELGTYGMVAKVFADGEDESLGSDRFRDVALDGSYQYITDEHQLSVHVNWIYEKQDWRTSFDQGLSSSPSTTLRTFRVDVHHFFRRTSGRDRAIFPDPRQHERLALQHRRTGDGKRQRQPEQQRLAAGGELAAHSEPQAGRAIYGLPAIQWGEQQL